jgi:hypothetical protein
MISITVLTGCIVNSTHPINQEMYLLEIDFEIQRCGWKKAEVQYYGDGAGYSEVGVSYNSNEIGPDEVFTNHISLQATKKQLLVTKKFFFSKEEFRSEEYPPGKVVLVIDGKKVGTYNAVSGERKSILLYTVHYRCEKQSPVPIPSGKSGT